MLGLDRPAHDATTGIGAHCAAAVIFDGYSRNVSELDQTTI